jgi:hypothetical protein
MLATFTTHCKGSVEDNICEGCIGSSMEFQEICSTKILHMEMMDDENETWMISMIMCRVDGCH